MSPKLQRFQITKLSNGNRCILSSVAKDAQGQPVGAAYTHDQISPKTGIR